MKIKNKNIFFWLFIVMVAQIFNTDLYSQITQQKPSRQAAIDAYSNGDYEKAYGEFNILVQSYSKDPLYKYYMGVCLVKMNRNPEVASGFLRDALNGSLDIKSIPDDAWFYLGRAQQMGGKFPDAIKSYNNFEKEVGKKRARDSNISGYIQECNEGRGRIKDSDYQHNDIISKTYPETKDPGQKVSDVKATKPPVVKQVQQKENLPAEYDKVLSQAMNYQVKADSLNALVSDYKKEYPRIPVSQQPAAKSRISELESKAAEYQQLADEKFGIAGSRPVSGTTVVTPPSVPDTNKHDEIYSLFSVETDIKNQKISIDPELPEGLIYRIQLGVFSKPLDPSFFKGISPVSGFRVTGTEATRYFVGMFRKMADASRSLLILKQMGFRDSFIAAVLDGKPVSIERASLLENEWGQKPLTINPPAQKSGVTAASTLAFRVEVTRSAKPASDEIAESYRKLAGNRGLEIVKTEDGTLVYLIGKFITFESASEYADLLKRNGYRDAKVAAYMGSKEIPVETAKQLFEK
jgi:tetratricopeptide (TPR) repeat protein